MTEKSESEARPQAIATRTDTYIDTYTPILWVSLNEEEKYAEYIRERKRVGKLEAQLADLQRAHDQLKASREHTEEF